MSEWHENAGTCPTRAMGKRVAVILRNGSVCGEKPVANGAPAGWPADGKGGCRWSLTGHDFDIVKYRIL